MKNNKEKAVMTAAEKLGEALVLKPEWEVKPKERSHDSCLFSYI